MVRFNVVMPNFILFLSNLEKKKKCLIIFFFSFALYSMYILFCLDNRKLEVNLREKTCAYFIVRHPSKTRKEKFYSVL